MRPRSRRRKPAPQIQGTRAPPSTRPPSPPLPGGSDVLKRHFRKSLCLHDNKHLPLNERLFFLAVFYMPHHHQQHHQALLDFVGCHSNTTDDDSPFLATPSLLGFLHPPLRHQQHPSICSIRVSLFFFFVALLFLLFPPTPTLSFDFVPPNTVPANSLGGRSQPLPCLQPGAIPSPRPIHLLSQASSPPGPTSVHRLSSVTHPIGPFPPATPVLF